jgi:hypothetical protein
MKKVMFGLFAALFALVAFAMPSPKQIEDALANKNYADAKSMIQEVLREKPDSARAHLLNAYLLIHVDKNRTAANAELQTAVGLDKKGDVKSSPLFGRIVTEIDMGKPAVKQERNIADVLGIAAALMLGLCAFAALLAVIRAIFDRPASTVLHVSGNGENLARSFGSSVPSGPSSGGAHYPQAATATILATQASPGMGAFGTAASVAGGVVAGNIISDMLHHGHSSRNYSDDSERRATYTPEPSPVSYESERSSFSSGSSDSWGSSDSSSSYSDSSSSSWD